MWCCQGIRTAPQTCEIVTQSTWLTRKQIWQKLISPSGEWVLRIVKGLEQPLAPENQGRVAVTCLLPVGDKLFGGDDIGRVVSFHLSFSVFTRCETDIFGSTNGNARNTIRCFLFLV